MAEFEFDRVERLRPSRLRELDEAARAFNRMMAGLRWFETYVPRQLVQRLVERDAPVVSEEKLVTVIFTDIVGFSTLAEQMRQPMSYGFSTSISRFWSIASRPKTARSTSISAIR